MKTERSETGSWIDIESTHRRKKKNEGNSKPSAHLEQLFEIVAEFHGFLRRIYQRTHCQVPNKSNADPV